jgi:phosphinothricin acetyltransferase
MVEIDFIPLALEHRVPVMHIFNYFVLNSFAAYPEEPLPESAFEGFLQMSQDLPAVAANEKTHGIVGFGFLHPLLPWSTFKRSLEITYFILPGYTNAGIGSQMLHLFIEKARSIPVDILMASISSKNEQSLRFHIKNGFVECGRFRNVGIKFGQCFDMVWMQKML